MLLNLDVSISAGSLITNTIAETVKEWLIRLSKEVDSGV